VEARFAFATGFLNFARNNGIPASTAKGTDPRNVAADDQRMDVVRAFVCGDGLKIHDMADHGVAIGNAGGAEDVARLPGAFQSHPNVVPLGERDLSRTRRAHLQHACETQRQ
jgi:hypothetical protein